MKVLVATDGSEDAIDAAQRAIGLLQPEAAIVLVTVIPAWEDPMAAAGGFESAGMTEEQADKEYAHDVEIGQSALEKTVSSLKAAGHDVEVQLAPSDREPGHTIVELAKEMHPDLIVIGTHGKGLLKRIFSGSVSDYLVHHAPAPVMVFRHDH